MPTPVEGDTDAGLLRLGIGPHGPISMAMGTRAQAQAQQGFASGEELAQCWGEHGAREMWRLAGGGGGGWRCGCGGWRRG